MENKLILDGVEYELSDELVEKLKGAVVDKAKAEPSCGPFDRESGCAYYYVDPHGEVSVYTDEDADYDEWMFAVGNYCRDKEMMKQRALHETLNRLLWRYSEMHGGYDDSAYSARVPFYISKLADASEPIVDYDADRRKVPGVVYFNSADVAQSAIEAIVKPFMAAHPEFKW